MKKLLVLMAVVVLTGAFAQGRLFGEAVFGISVTPAFGLDLELRAGAENLLGPLTLRGGARVVSAGSSTVFGLSADALLPFRLQGTNLYAGLGGAVIFAKSTVFQLRGILGLEFPVEGKFSLLTEVVPRYDFGSSQFGLGISLGPRLYF